VARKLEDGVYDEVVTTELGRVIEEHRSRRDIEVAELRSEVAHVVLARYLRGEIERAFGDADGLETQVELANVLLRAIAETKLASEERQIEKPARLLYGVFADKALRPTRPEIPLSESALLTLGRGEPRIGSELCREIDSADRVDALVSFVTQGGIRQLRDAIEALSRKHRAGTPPVFRLLTTTYIGATEAAAVEELARLPGVEVRVSYDGRRTRLHAKAWLFYRASGLSTAYVGSANLSAPALTSGLEWMMKTSATDLPAVIKKFAGAFETLWEDHEFEPFDARNEQHIAKLRGALSAAHDGDNARVLTFFTLEPYPFQREILERLAAERLVHGRHRNLVIAATGTGKTVIAAFDYAARAAAIGNRPRLLFLAHNRKILNQARDTFRAVLRASSFGSLLTGQDEPESLDHVFATIQTLRSRGLVDKLGADHWDHVIVDECHHAPADSYQDVIPRIRPTVLVGLTATPERTDGRSLLVDFDGRVAAELRLWQALERQLLVPFEYYGISDGVDAAQMNALRFSRHAGYEAAELDKLYTGNHTRADLVIAELARKVADVRRLRGLGFCVTVKHAEFMANHFTRQGIPARFLDGTSTLAEREAAEQDLEACAINVIFTCDLFNEGVDLPFVDTLLLLRPTQSSTIFLQQLGRGLRLHKGKASCLVLDFIGQHRADFRFDAILSTWTGIARNQLTKAVENHFPFLPTGCTISLDRVSRDTVLRSLRTTVEATWKRLVAEAASIAGTSTELELGTFLEQSGRDLEDIYRLQRGSWTKLCYESGLVAPNAPKPSEAELELCHRVGRLAHIDDRDRLGRYRSWAERRSEPANGNELREALMLGYQLEHESKAQHAAESVVPWLRSHPPACDELAALARELEGKVAVPSTVRPVVDWPLVLHHHYSRREIVTATGYWTSTKKVPQQQGVLRFGESRRELLFVTIDKSSGGFSPTTSYRDFALSSERFHWETQNAVSDDSDTMRRYANHVANGWSIYLFVQPRKTTPFAFLGPVTYERHEGSRPVAIVWRLESPIPAALFTSFATLANG
jgi:superfamily II DNA or RNA helicase